MALVANPPSADALLCLSTREDIIRPHRMEIFSEENRRYPRGSPIIIGWGDKIYRFTSPY